MKKPKDIAAYIKLAPKEIQAKLKQLRKIIKTTAPEAIEKISYGIPYYHYKGRLVYFAFAKKHIGLYFPTPIIAEHQNELKEYSITKATIRLPLNKKLPVRLIQKLIKARMMRNELTSKK
jgi:uncharacterized protein YdhG (YjbR/CyaY superfamily)